MKAQCVSHKVTTHYGTALLQPSDVFASQAEEYFAFTSVHCLNILQPLLTVPTITQELSPCNRHECSSEHKNGSQDALVWGSTRQAIA